MKHSKISMLVRLALVGSSVGLAFSASAQQQDSQSEVLASKKKADEKITVTGSRLRRDSFSVATPLVTLGRDSIEDTGLGSLAEILIEELPQLDAGTSNSNSQSSVQNTGLSTIDLRKLGTNRTLTLIDGRRVVSNSYSGNYVSLTTIPSGMVDRVEIISGGASAAYGSDAVAGVVNIITQKDKQGFSTKVRTGETAAGGGEEYSFDIDFGSDFADGDGYVFAAFSYDKQEGISFWDRDRAQQELAYRYNSTTMRNEVLTENGYQPMSEVSMSDWRNRSDGLLGGVFGEYSRNDTQFWYDGQTLRNDWKDNEEKYGLNYKQWDMLKVPDEATRFAIKVDYDFTDDVMGYFQVQMSQNDSVNVKAPEDEYESAYALTLDPVTGAPGRVRPGYIPIDNPYVPEEIRNSGLYKDRIYWDRRFAEVGNVTTDNDRTTLRSWAGLQGTMFDGDWNWDLSVSFGKFKQEQLRLNELNTFRVANALDAEYAADGSIQCADADARAEGCVALNLFGEGSITPEMADYIRANPTITTNIEQTNILGVIDGDLFEMPAGTVAAAFGLEYRKDYQSVRTSDEQQYGGVTFNVVPSFSGRVEVYEAFAEAAFPLLRDASWAKSLTAEASLRVADYSWAGTGLTNSYKLGLIWEPVQGYMVRSNYAKAERAPTITELMSPPRGDYDSFDDICDGVTATSTSKGHDACRMEPTIAALIAEDPNFEFEDDNNSYSPNTGNPDLVEESANTFTLGLTMSPEWADGFQLAIDYYDIKIDDAISQISNADIINQCYNSDTPWGEGNSFCNDITRDDEGNIIEILQRSFNVDEIRTRGYDVAAAYSWSVGEYGEFKFKADLTHVIEHSNTFETESGKQTNHYVGDLSRGIFRDKASMSLTWYKDEWRVSWRTKYKSDAIDSLSDREKYYGALDENNEGGIFLENEYACQQGLDSCVENPEAPEFYLFDDIFTHNLSMSYTMEVDEQTFRFFAGVNNVFDENGEYYYGGRGNYSSRYGGGTGRFYYLGAEYSF